MVKQMNIYEKFSDLLCFPQEDIKLKTEECLGALRADGQYPAEAVEHLEKFATELEEMPLDDLQGVYSYTFELSSDFTLDLGYHLFDGFKRANNLSSIKSMYQSKNFPVDEVAKGELPDNLVVILKFLGFVQDEELKKDFRESFVILAVEKLRQNFNKHQKNIYSHLISAVYRVLDTDVKEGK
jgi:nitrate reductase assembly molybdenum cofactor insertion protein NarJ